MGIIKHRSVGRSVCLFIVWAMVAVMGCGCSQDVSSDDRFAGSWRMKKGKAHKILIFRANSTWQSQVRKEGRLGRVVAKQEEFSGTWEVVDNYLHMTATQAKMGDAWKVGETISFEIVQIDATTMRIKKPNGTIERWTRVKSQKAEEKERLARALSIDPIVVNLRKEKPGAKEHYLCIELEFVFRPGKEGAPLPSLHPKVRETAIFYLSSQTYSEVNTMEKVARIKDHLLRLLNPYAHGQIESIAIQNITVTSRWKSVEAFLNQYRDVPPESMPASADQPGDQS